MGRLAALALIVAVAVVLAAPMQTALAAAEVETELETLKFGRGDSLSVLLTRAGVRAVDVDRISKAIQKQTNLRRMSIRREVRLLFKAESERRRIPVAPAPAADETAVQLADLVSAPPQKPAPKTVDTAPADADQISDDTARYDGPQHPVEPELIELSRTLRSGSTLMDLLLDADVRRPEADAIVRSLRRVFNPRRLPAGVTVRVAKKPVEGFEPRVALLDIELPKGRHIVVEREEKGLFSSRITKEPPVPAQPRAVAIAAEVDRTAPIAAPAAPVDAPPPSASRITVRSGDTLMAILRRHGIDRVEANRAIQAARKLFNLRRLRVGQEITLVTGIDETGALTLKTVALRIGTDCFVRVFLTADNHFEAERVDRLRPTTDPLQRAGAVSAQPESEPRGDEATSADRDALMTCAGDEFSLPSEADQALNRVLQRAVGAIDSNLYPAALDVGVPYRILMEMVHIFSFDVDFQRDIRRGSRFKVLYESVFNKAGELVENGPILYAKIEVGEREIELFRYEPEEEPPDYLDIEGASVRKALMRTPINGTRLSSSYGMHKHPILGYSRKHRGVDFAAPTGTPVYAGGDGTISMLGRHGNYGKYIRIHHNGTYSTGYAHLNSYARGMKKGTRVRQGQVIGYVGNTGMSPGQHLHYEVMAGNKRIDPMTLKLPSVRKLEGRELAQFQQQTQKIKLLLTEPIMALLAQPRLAADEGRSTAPEWHSFRMKPIAQDDLLAQ